MTCKRCGMEIPDDKLDCALCLSSVRNAGLPNPLYALSLWQPWAQLIVTGEKKFETRSWTTNMRGVIAIHASQSYATKWKELAKTPWFSESLERGGAKDSDALVTGSIIGLCSLVEIYRTEQARYDATSQEHRFGNFDDNRYAYLMGDPIALKNPIRIRGWQRFWRVPDWVREKIKEQLNAKSEDAVHGDDIDPGGQDSIGDRVGAGHVGSAVGSDGLFGW